MYRPHRGALEWHTTALVAFPFDILACIGESSSCAPKQCQGEGGGHSPSGTGPTLHFLAWLFDYLYSRPSCSLGLPNNPRLIFFSSITSTSPPLSLPSCVQLNHGCRLLFPHHTLNTTPLLPTPPLCLAPRTSVSRPLRSTSPVRYGTEVLSSTNRSRI